jgi:hypothetical protein
VTAGCGVCEELGEVEMGSQKGGWPDQSTFIPVAMDRLEEVVDLGTDGSRLHRLLRCPECRRFFRYDTDYEFIVPGTEDSQVLRRLSDAEANALQSDPGQ